jgi:hypothetical protein
MFCYATRNHQEEHFLLLLSPYHPAKSSLRLPLIYHHINICAIMLVSTATRSLIRSNGAVLRQNVRLMSSIASSEKANAAVGYNTNTTAKREIHSDPPQMKSAPSLQYASPPTYFPEDAADEKEEASSTSGLVDRFKITAEVTVSKIFPAGFGYVGNRHAARIK